MLYSSFFFWNFRPRLAQLYLWYTSMKLQVPQQPPQGGIPCFFQSQETVESVQLHVVAWGIRPPSNSVQFTRLLNQADFAFSSMHLPRKICLLYLTKWKAIWLIQSPAVKIKIAIEFHGISHGKTTSISLDVSDPKITRIGCWMIMGLILEAFSPVCNQWKIKNNLRPKSPGKKRIWHVESIWLDSNDPRGMLELKWKNVSPQQAAFIQLFNIVQPFPPEFIFRRWSYPSLHSRPVSRSPWSSLEVRPLQWDTKPSASDFCLNRREKKKHGIRGGVGLVC